MNDTEKLRELEGQIAFLPPSFGYGIEEGAELFPEFYFPTCDSFNWQDPEEKMSLDVNKH
jgi:hypothetical protein